MAVRTADDYLNNTAWVTRIKGFFDRVDQNKNGTIEVKDFEDLLANVNREIKPDAKVYENFRQVVMEHITNMGITPGKKLTKDEYVKNMAKMAVVENAKKGKGEKASLAKVNDALYDMVDINRDGFVTLDEFRTVTKVAYGCNAAEAEAGFRAIDTNKNGKIERKELTDYEVNFWFGLDDEANKELYGTKFEK